MAKRDSKLDRMSKGDLQDLHLRLMKAQNSLCYVCGDAINLSVQKVDVDHIVSLAMGGEDEESNFGLTHASCNRSKGARDLRLQRILHNFKKHVDKHTGTSEVGLERKFTLHEALEELCRRRVEVGVQRMDSEIRISWENDGIPHTETFYLIEDESDPRTTFFVGMIPFICVHHDKETNPRSIIDLEAMITEFYNGYPQLQPSLAMLDIDSDSGRGRILVFDGQHKAAAQLYAQRRRLFLRVFVDPDRSRLRETNYRAHTRLAQVHFPQLINDRVGADLFLEEFEAYRKQNDWTKASEEKFFRNEIEHQLVSEYKGYFRNYLRHEVLTGQVGNDVCRILDFTETVTPRSRRFPISYDALQKTFLQTFLYLKATKEPLEESERYRRLERENMIRLMNLFSEEILEHGRFDLSLGIHRMEERLANNPESVPDSHLCAYRICRRAAMAIWIDEFKGAITTLLSTKTRYPQGGWSAERPLWAEIQSEDWTQIRNMIRGIRDHKIWKERANHEIINAMASTKQKDWEAILKHGRLPDRDDDPFPPLGQNQIFQKATSGN